MRPSSLPSGVTARNALVTSRPFTVTLTAGGAEGAEAPVISMSASPPLTMSGRLDTTRMSTLPCANELPPAGTSVRSHDYTRPENPCQPPHMRLLASTAREAIVGGNEFAKDYHSPTKN